MIEIGLILALGCALLSNVAVLCEHRGAMRAPDVTIRRPIASAVALFRSKWWAIGFGIAFFGWVFHVGALALAPLSMVQAVIAGGLALLALPARYWFGIKLGMREMIGLGLSAVGLAFLALTATTGSHDTGSSYSMPAMIAFEGGLVVIGMAMVLSAGSERGARHGGLLLGASVGLLLGVSDVAIKALTGPVLSSPLGIISPWTLLAICAGIGAFYALARALQLGDPVEVAVITSVSCNVSAIFGGVIVFGDPIGSDALAIVARSAAFLAVIAAAALIPNAAPHRQPTRA